MIETKEIKLSNLHPNTGQIEGVPTNPRKAEKGQIDKLKKSIEETPEMLELRELVAYDNGGELVIVGGNMRYKALKELGHKTALVKVLPADTPKEVINAFIIKDNAQFGDWDLDLLSMEWDTSILSDWGVDLNWGGVEVDSDQMSDSFTLPSGDKEPYQQMTFTLADEQAISIKDAIATAKGEDGFKAIETFGNSNSNGNALTYIVEQWVELKK